MFCDNTTFVTFHRSSVELDRQTDKQELSYLRASFRVHPTKYFITTERILSRASCNIEMNILKTRETLKNYEEIERQDF